MIGFLRGQPINLGTPPNTSALPGRYQIAPEDCRRGTGSGLLYLPAIGSAFLPRDSPMFAIHSRRAVLLAQPPAPAVSRSGPGKAPHAVGDTKPTSRALTVYLGPEEKANGAAVVICPGGGYGFLADGPRGQAGRRVLQHARRHRVRAASTASSTRSAPARSQPAPLQDAQRAIRLVRSKAQGVRHRPEAGRHHGLLGRRPPGQHRRHALRRRRRGRDDPIDELELPAGLPASSATRSSPWRTASTHGGSKNNLLGRNPDAKLVESTRTRSR